MPNVQNLMEIIDSMAQDKHYQEMHWEGTFEEYLNIATTNPRVLRTAFQRIYDMIISHGLEEYTEHKERLQRFNFFSNEKFGGRESRLVLTASNVESRLPANESVSREVEISGIWVCGI